MAASQDMTETAASSAPSSQAESKCPAHVLEAIYGKPKNKEEKQAEYQKSLKNWWTTYAERRHDEEEYVADT